MLASEALSQFVGEELACEVEESLTEMGSGVAQVGEQVIQGKCCLVSMQGQPVCLGWDSKAEPMSAFDKHEKIPARRVQAGTKDSLLIPRNKLRK